MVNVSLLACPIWNFPAPVTPNGDAFVVNSARAGGNYRVTGSALESLRNLTPEQRVSLTWWLVEQRRQGESNPEINSNVIRNISSISIPSISERRDRILEFVAASSPTIIGRVQFSGTVTEKMREQRASLAAHSASQNDAEVNELVGFAKEERLLDGADVLKLTFKGWSHIEERRSKRVATLQGFVAMWFNPTMSDAYERGFLPAIVDSGYVPMRIDRKEHVNKIDDEIIAEIRRSRFLVADFTSESEKPRGGVYFEAGFALGINIPVIWTCRSDLVDELHLDIRQFNQIVWTEPSDLYKKLKNRIGAVIGDGPLAGVRA